MTTAIIVAMQKELDLLLPLIDNKQTETVRGIEIVRGKIAGHDVAAAKCGIGKVNSAITTLTIIEHINPALVINTGVAGGADVSLHQLDTVVADRVAYHDVWCGPGTEYGAAAGLDVFLIPDADTANKICKGANGGNVYRGLICSGDKFISTAEEVAEIKRNFPDALAVDMESASIAQVCTMKGVPFNIVRVLSDTPGQHDDNVAQYEDFWTAAPATTFALLKNYFGNL